MTSDFINAPPQPFTVADEEKKKTNTNKSDTAKWNRPCSLQKQSGTVRTPAPLSDSHLFVINGKRFDSKQ